MFNNKKKDDSDELLKSVKKEIKFLDATLIGLFICAIIFIVYHSIMVYRTMYEPSSLIVSVFGFFGFECGCMASIQKRKMTLKDIEYSEYNKDEKKQRQEEDISVQQEIESNINSSDLPQNHISLDSIKEEASDNNGNT